MFSRLYVIAMPVPSSIDTDTLRNLEFDNLKVY